MSAPRPVGAATPLRSPQPPADSIGYLRHDETGALTYYGKLHHPDAVVEWGSITKTATAAALTWAHDSGALDLDAPLSEHLSTDLDQRTTARHLAEHTSGLPRMPPGRWEEPDPYVGTGRTYLTATLDHLGTWQRTPPGTTHTYSNLGYALIGEVLLRATGRTWWQTLRSGPLRTLQRGGQIHFYPPEHQRVLPTDEQGRPRTPWDLTHSSFAPAGALWSTLPALAEYTATHASHQETALGWQNETNLRWHNGATRDSQTFTALSHDGRVVAAHGIGAPWRSIDDFARALIA